MKYIIQYFIKFLVVWSFYGCSTVQNSTYKDEPFFVRAIAVNADLITDNSQPPEECLVSNTICGDNYGYRVKFRVESSDVLSGKLDEDFLYAEIFNLEKINIVGQRFLLVGEDSSSRDNAKVQVSSPYREISCINDDLISKNRFKSEIESVLTTKISILSENSTPQLSCHLN